MRRFLLVLLLLFPKTALGDDGSKLWLNYKLIENESYRKQLIQRFKVIEIRFESDANRAAAEEVQRAFKGLTGREIPILLAMPMKNGHGKSYPHSIILNHGAFNPKKDGDGYIYHGFKKGVLINGNTKAGLMAGTFAFIRKMQLLEELEIKEKVFPKIQIRMLNHWDNANGTVERGYAGSSIWKWHELPYRIDPRYKDYARANASIGINAVSLNNVNASSRFLTSEYLEKIKAVADVLRPYGIKVFISVNFRSPRTLGGLETSDPLDASVRAWWRKKTEEIYTYIPDFGGFLVKANSEGEPGPQDYGRTHADGANMLAEALKGFNGIVVWRAFVYNADPNGDRFKEAYEQFKPLDGKFHQKVLVQVKNGPIDFMPREPFHPLFGAMPKTPLAMEFQITQEYLGHATHLVYLAPMFKEVLDWDTHFSLDSSTVANVIDGTLHSHKLSLMAGVANTGSDANWTGHPMAQANWYAFGRLAWDYTLSSEQIAREWVQMTHTKKPEAVQKIVDLLLKSHQTYINYTYPLGLHHMMGEGHHYGPQPWLEKSGRPDWTSTYYHRAAESGIGFDRTGEYSNALSLYAPQVQQQWNNPATCDLNYLLWFHHLPWHYTLSTGNTLWDELIKRYYRGVEEVQYMQQSWEELEGEIDKETFQNVKGRLAIQHKEALWWRDACYLYFREFSKLPLPSGLEEPIRTLKEVKELEQIYHLR